MEYLITYTGPAHVGTPTIGLSHYLETMQYIETADTAREAIEQWYRQREDSNYFPQEDGSIRDGNGDTIAQPDDDRISYDGGHFEALEIIHRNKWCMILQRGGVYILRSNSGKYNDQYFRTSTDALKAIGIRA